MEMDGKEMDGKVVVLTGASMGIGEAIAMVFADAGASVALLSRDASRAEAARQRIGHTDRTLALACDVRNREEVDRALASTLGRFHRVDVWVNNAGVGIRDSVVEMQPPYAAICLKRISSARLLACRRWCQPCAQPAAEPSSTSRALPDTFRFRL